MREFEEAINANDGDLSGVKVPIPMATVGHDGPYGSGAWYWTELDGDVLSLLQSHGAELSFPQKYKGEYFNSDLAWFFMFCPPSIVGRLLEDHGVDAGDIDFSAGIMGMSTTMALKVSGNEHAFRWIKENKPEALSMGQLKVPDLLDTALFIPLIEDKEDKSLSSPKLYDAIKEMISQCRTREAAALAPKIRLTEAKVKELLELAEKAKVGKGPYALALISGLEERLEGLAAERKPSKGGSKKPLVWNKKLINEFVSFAEHGDIASMSEYMESVGGGKLPDDGPLDQWNEGVPKAQYRLWEESVINRDVALLDFLVSKGMRLQDMVDARGWTLMDHAHIHYRDPKDPSPSRESTRAYLMKLLDEGVKCSRCNENDVAILLDKFPGDHELFDRLHAIGFLFHHKDKYEEGDTDAENVAKAIRDSGSHEANWGDAAYILCHGARLKGTSSHAKEVWKEFEEHPTKTAELVKIIPPESISPASRLLPTVAASGDIDACKALAAWEGAYESDAIDAAILRATEAGHTEIVAYLLEMKDSYRGDCMSLEIGGGSAKAPELADEMDDPDESFSPTTKAAI